MTLSQQILLKWNTFADAYFKSKNSSLGLVQSMFSDPRSTLDDVVKKYPDIDMNRGSYDLNEMMIGEMDLSKAIKTKKEAEAIKGLNFLLKNYKSLGANNTSLSFSVAVRIDRVIKEAVQTFQGASVGSELKKLLDEVAEQSQDMLIAAAVVPLLQAFSKNHGQFAQLRIGALIRQPEAINIVYPVIEYLYLMSAKSFSRDMSDLYSRIQSELKDAYNKYKKDSWKGVSPEAQASLTGMFEKSGRHEIEGILTYFAHLEDHLLTSSGSVSPEIKAILKSPALKSELNEKVVKLGQNVLKSGDKSKLLSAKDAKSYMEIDDELFNESIGIKINSDDPDEKGPGLKNTSLLIRYLDYPEGSEQNLLGRLNATIKFNLDAIIAKAGLGEMSDDARIRVERFIRR